MAKFSERLKELRKAHKLTQPQLADKLNVGKSTVAMWETGDRQPDYKTLQKIADFFNVSVDYLLGRDRLATLQNAVPYHSPSMERIPVLGTIRAGEPIDRIENIEGYELVEPDILRGRKAFILHVQGDSMIGDNIFDGDRVIVVLQNQVEPTDIAVVSVNGDEATLKRVKCQNGMCMLIPSNPEMEPMLYPAEKIFIIGKVIEVRHRLE